MTSKRIINLEKKIESAARAFIKSPSQRNYERFEALEQRYHWATSEWYLMPHMKVYLKAQERRHE